MTASSAHPSPKSTYLTDPLLLPFLAPSFSATSYLNTTLPSPPSKTHANAQQQPQPTLSALASQTQFQISTLSAQTSRLSATLTALTDDILRCSSRLTYEIEVLRGEANGMAEALGERGDLNEAIKTFVPEGLPSSTLNGIGNGIGNGASKRDDEDTTTTQHPQDREQAHPPSQYATDTKQSNKTASATDPPITQLRTLLHVRASLTSITRTFSLALSWPMPPSLLPSSSSSTTSSLISITSPSSQSTTSSLETAGQTALANIKREIEEMLVAGDIERARERVRELKGCVEVWKGTSEEKARGKWVGEVEGWVEEVGGGMVRRGLVRGEGGGVGKGDGNGNDRVVGDEVRKGDGERRVGAGGRGGVEPAAPARTGSGAGFLRRLRDEIYME